MSHAVSSPKPKEVTEESAQASEPKFDAVIPWESALELVSIVRSGQLVEKRIRGFSLRPGFPAVLQLRSASDRNRRPVTMLLCSPRTSQR